jgi:hypothetical protein
MKNRLISGIVFLVFGLLIALGPQIVFPVCRIPDLGEEVTQQTSEKSMGMSDHNLGTAEGTAKRTTEGTTEGTTSMSILMKCHWTARAELGVGLLIALEGFLLILFGSRQIRFGLNAAIGLNGILALLFPTVLIGVCSSTRMNCRSLTLPALVIISGSLIAGSVINGIYLYQTDRIGGRTYGSKTPDHRTALKE